MCHVYGFPDLTALSVIPATKSKAVTTSLSGTHSGGLVWRSGHRLFHVVDQGGVYFSVMWRPCDVARTIMQM